MTINFFWRLRNKNRIDIERLQQLKILLFLPRILLKILIRTKLRGIHKDTHNNSIAREFFSLRVLN